MIEVSVVKQKLQDYIVNQIIEVIQVLLYS